MSRPRTRTCLLLPALALGAACGGDKAAPIDEGPGDSGAGCEAASAWIPVDETVVGLLHTADGVEWAVGDAGGWWRAGEAGWEALPAMRGPIGPATSAGERLWALGSDTVSWSEGGAWTEVSTGLEWEWMRDIAGLSDGQVAVVSVEGCDDCETVPTHLLIGGAAGFTQTELLGLTSPPNAVGADDAGGALAAGGDLAWRWDGASWIDEVLPVEGRWVDVLGFDGEWALLSSDGLLLVGAEGAWVEREVSGFGPVTAVALAGTSLDDLWVVGQLGDEGEAHGAVWHDEGEGFIEVSAPASPITAATATSPGALRLGLTGPEIAEGGAGGFSTTWTTPHWEANGAAVSLSDGTNLFIDTDGRLTVGNFDEWTVRGEMELEHPETVLALSLGEAAYAVTESGAFLDWDVTTAAAARSDLALGDEMVEALAVTGAGEPVVGGFGFQGEGEEQVPTGMLLARAAGEWTEIALPEGAGPIYAIDAPTLTELTVWDTVTLWTGDGSSWTAVESPGWVQDLQRGPDDRLWLALDGEVAGLAELVGGVVEPVADGPGPLRWVLPVEGAVLTVAYEDGETILGRWDGAWTELDRRADYWAVTRPDAADLEGERLLLLSDLSIERVCLPGL